MQTPTQGYYQQGYYQQASYQRTTRRGVSPYEAPGYGAFAMQTPRRSVRGARGGSYAIAPMTAERHTVF